MSLSNAPKASPTVSASMQEGHEETVIGFLMIYPDYLTEYASIVGPELFTHEKNRLVIDALATLYSKGIAISLISVCDLLERTNRLRAAGGRNYLEHLAADFYVGPAAMKYAISELREQAAERAVANIGKRMVAGQISVSEARVELERAEAGSVAYGITVRTADEILGMQLDEHDCLMGDRILAKGQSLVIAGPSGIGKSHLLLQLSVACILGKEWCSFTTHAKGLSWLILQTENSTRRLQNDLRALQRWCGDQWSDVGQLLHIHTLETDRDGILTLSNPETVRRIEATIQQVKPGIMSLDPFRDFMIGDPNSDADMAATLATIGAICRRGNPQRAIVLAHHALTGRAGAAKAVGYDRSSFARNSKVLHGWTRAQINVAPGSADNNDPLVLTCGKNSNGKEFPAFAVSLNPMFMVYESDEFFDLNAWREEVTSSKAGGRKVFKPKVVEQVLGTRQMNKKDLTIAIMNEEGCGKSRAYQLVEEAVKQKLIRSDKITGNYAGAAA